MRFITWNINSVRLRIGLIEKLVRKYKPDILCLQETKVIDDSFPFGAFDHMGFVQAHVNGMKSYNGVAILSRLPLQDCAIRPMLGRDDCRHIFATLPNGTEIHCSYVPAGGDIPDPALNPKFAHKLAYLDEMAEWSKQMKRDKKSRLIMGDFNVAPLENDVWSHKQMLDVVSHTPIEVEKLKAWQKAGGWVDALRAFVPPSEKLYTWWSYRAQDWKESNRGRRLDHIWVTPDLAPSLKRLTIIGEARGWLPKPSDHVPVILDLD